MCWAEYTEVEQERLSMVWWLTSQLTVFCSLAESTVTEIKNWKRKRKKGGKKRKEKKKRGGGGGGGGGRKKEGKKNWSTGRN